MSDSLVIIPTLNEIENIKAIVSTVLKLPKKFHVLVVDDASNDGTPEVVLDLMNVFPDRLFLENRVGEKGLGSAYIHGFKWALRKNYAYVIEMDADFSHNPDDLIKLYKACDEEGAKLAVGSRYIDNNVNVVNWNIKRLVALLLCIKIRAIHHRHSCVRYHCWICLLPPERLGTHRSGQNPICGLCLSN
jgi:dolichol-phosphate mannosyltransferase